LWENMSVEDFLSGLQLDHLHEIFCSEHIMMDVLVDTTHKDLQSIGITAFGAPQERERTCTQQRCW